MSDQVVASDPVLPVSRLQVWPLVTENQIRYAVMSAPPSSAGALHDRSICDEPTAVAVRSVGAPGGSAGVVALATFDAGPLPAELIADTR